MAQERLIKVCVIEDSNGKVLFVGKVKQVNQMELNNLTNKATATRQEYAQQLKEALDRIKELENRCNSNEQEIKVLKGEE